MEPFDIVLKEIEMSSRSKTVARNVGAQIKELLKQDILDIKGIEEEIDLSPDFLIATIAHILEYVKERREIIGNLALLEELLKLQKQLLWHCKVNFDRTLQYQRFIDNCEEIYNMIRSSMKELEKLKFTFELDFSKPTQQTLVDIDAYRESLKIAARSMSKIWMQCKEMECTGLMPFFVFHYEVIGNEADWEAKLNHWYNCYQAYVLHHVQGRKKVDVVRELAASPSAASYLFNLNDMSNATHKLDTFLKEALRLIASVENGTFPC
ncbi:hypothetical protein KP004_06775 [Geomonas oryzisoli]|uniref:Uncharacterized protein n=1 Tax=Geomonas oryzisoli TaxID=2847992 RepID=A0ABX8JHB7_9BACT|nr:hypothetical protein [Geomonas oryzisoli]QWV94875.1 hypothetical protein KP004_06775 [Geomonas oryzisoli]